VRAPSVLSKPVFSWWSREVLLLVNNVILTVTAITVLLGTLYPLIIDALGMGRISVGPPYFNAMFVPLMSLLFVFMGFAASSKWKKTTMASSKLQLLIAAAVSVLLALLLPFWYGTEFSVSAALAVLFSLWITVTVLQDVRDKVRLGSGSVGKRLQRLSRSYWGMQLGHLGVAMCIIGVAFTSTYSDKRDVKLTPGESVAVQGYNFVFGGVRKVQGPNFDADEAQIRVYLDGREQYLLQPQKRIYRASGQTMTEAAIEPGFTRDLYVALGERLEGDAWSVRVHYKAFVNWIWLGGLVMSLGGLLALMDKRYRIRERKRIGSESGSQPTVENGAIVEAHS